MKFLKKLWCKLTSHQDGTVAGVDMATDKPVIVFGDICKRCGRMKVAGVEK